MKYKRLNFKSNDSKNGRNHTCKSDDIHNGGNWKSKFHKVIKTDKGLNSTMSTIATKEKSKQGLISEVYESSS